MPFNLLILPFLGGFFFAEKWLLTQYYFSHARGNRLLGYAAIAAVPLTAIAFLITSLLKYFQPNFISQLQVYLPYDFTGTAILAMALGFVLPYLLNSFINPESKSEDIIDKHGTMLEKFLQSALRNNDKVALTLKHRRVYVGYLVEIDLTYAEEGGKYVKLLPTRSGYRDPDTLLMHLDIDYRPLFDTTEEVEGERSPGRRDGTVTVVDEENGIGDYRDLLVYFACSEILSFNCFDDDYYNRLHPNQEVVVRGEDLQRPQTIL